ncbi:hypothetical protein GSQ54_09470 [Clostridioides difficile]|nr:hypothetical protein [Clostridioides difficile]NJI80678.1 hypothetical protein [Clostridioides difficile]
MEKEELKVIYLEDLCEIEKTSIHRNTYQIFDEEYEGEIDRYYELSQRSSYEIINRKHKEDFKDELWDYDDTNYNDRLQGREI